MSSKGSKTWAPAGGGAIVGVRSSGKKCLYTSDLFATFFLIGGLFSCEGLFASFVFMWRAFLGPPPPTYNNFCRCHAPCFCFIPASLISISSTLKSALSMVFIFLFYFIYIQYLYSALFIN